MIRKKGYCVKGKRLLYRDEFNRKPRESLLCFLDQNGMRDSFHTEGTFDRKLFIECCKEFSLKSGHVFQYPGQNSIWILDGAKIHCHQDICFYLRSLGLKIIYLPAYCSFFNPIEIIFELTKRYMRRYYQECSTKPLLFHIVSISTF